MCPVASRQADCLGSINMYRAASGVKRPKMDFNMTDLPLPDHLSPPPTDPFQCSGQALQHLFGTEGFGDTCKGYHAGHAEKEATSLDSSPQDPEWMTYNGIGGGAARLARRPYCDSREASTHNCDDETKHSCFDEAGNHVIGLQKVPVC